MKKLPWAQFWHRDWLADRKVRATKDWARAYWMDTLCYFWEGRICELTQTVADWARMWGVTNAKAGRIILEFKRTDVASVTFCGKVTLCHTQVTVLSRRLKREINRRKQGAKRQATFRSRKSNTRVTPLSHGHTDTETYTDTKTPNTSCPELAKASPVPTALKSLSLYAKDKKLCAKWDALQPAWAEAFPGVDIVAEVAKAHAWEQSNPKRRKRDRAKFLNAWLSRAQDKPRAGDSESSPYKQLPPYRKSGEDE